MNESLSRQELKEFCARPVLVTGASGFIGANLVERLVSAGADVHALVRRASSSWRLKATRDLIHLHMCDVTDGAGVARLISTIRPEFVWHLAVERPGSGDDESRRMVRGNVEGTLNVLEAASRVYCKRVVIAGSSLEYGPHSAPIRETSPLRPSTFFGATKAAASIVARQYARQFDLPAVILRPFSVFGCYEAPNRLVPTAIVAALDGLPLRVTAPGFRRDFVFVDDVVNAFAAAARTQALDPGEVLNIGSGRQIANEHVVSIIESEIGRPILIADDPYPPRETDTTHWVSDPALAVGRIGWQPTVSFEEGVRRTVRFIEAHRDDYPGREMRSSSAANVA